MICFPWGIRFLFRAKNVANLDWLSVWYNLLTDLKKTVSKFGAKQRWNSSVTPIKRSRGILKSLQPTTHMHDKARHTSYVRASFSLLISITSPFLFSLLQTLNYLLSPYKTLFIISLSFLVNTSWARPAIYLGYLLKMNSLMAVKLCPWLDKGEWLLRKGSHLVLVE